MIFTHRGKKVHNIFLNSEHSGRKFAKDGKHGIDPSQIEFRHFFDIASGIRGTDDAHRAALDCYERIIPMLKTHDGTLEVAGAGLEIAEETRSRMANILGCEPRNVFFGSSATRTLIPIFLALGKVGKYTFVSARQGYGTILGILENSSRIMNESSTRQNFGEFADPIALRRFDDQGAMGEFSRNFKFRIVIPNESTPDSFDPETGGLGGRKRTRGPYIVYYQHTDRITGRVEMQEDVAELRARVLAKGPQSLVLADATHSVGAVEFRAQDLGDIVMMNSSKALGAEPTLGICYVSDRVLRLLEVNLPKTRWPNIAFQFSPETSLGLSCVRDAADARYWTSLPELFSLHEALDGFDIRERITRLREIKLYFQAALRIFEFYSCRIKVLSGEAGFVPNISSFMLDRQLEEIDTRWEDLGNGRKRMLPSGETLMSDSLVHYMAPFVFTCESPMFQEMDHSCTDENTNPHVRLSWSHTHSIGDAKAFGKRMAVILDSILEAMEKDGFRVRSSDEILFEQFFHRPGFIDTECHVPVFHRFSLSESLESVETALFGDPQAARVFAETSKNMKALKVIAACHEDAEVRRLAFNRLGAEKFDLKKIAWISEHADIAVPATRAVFKTELSEYMLADVVNKGHCKTAREEARKELEAMGKLNYATVTAKYNPLEYLIAFFGDRRKKRKTRPESR